MTEGVGLVLEGGGFRGIYTAGILDVFLRENIRFNYVIGVSAGAAYGVSYVSGQLERNLEVNRYVSDKRYCSWKNFIRTGNYFNWEFVYREIPLNLIPFDYGRFSGSGIRMRIAVTHCVTGKSMVFDLNGSSPDRFCDLLTATSSLPFISRVKMIDGQPYMDGGISDAIPVKQALEDGNKRIVVILTRPPGYKKKNSGSRLLMKGIYHRYPGMVNSFLERAERYNNTLREIDRLESTGRAFVIRPKKALSVDRIENNPAKLRKVYDFSATEMQGILPGLKQWLKQGNGKGDLHPK
jgi:predicted patatin/cPLA2 family phospholipase